MTAAAISYRSPGAAAARIGHEAAALGCRAGAAHARSARWQAHGAAAHRAARPGAGRAGGSGWPRAALSPAGRGSRQDCQRDSTRPRRHGPRGSRAGELRARLAPDLHKALHGGETRQREQQSEQGHEDPGTMYRRERHAEEDEPLGPLHEAALGVIAERLGLGPLVGDDGAHADDREGQQRHLAGRCPRRSTRPRHRR